MSSSTNAETVFQLDELVAVARRGIPALFAAYPRPNSAPVVAVDDLRADDARRLLAAAIDEIAITRYLLDGAAGQSDELAKFRDGIAICSLAAQGVRP